MPHAARRAPRPIADPPPSRAAHCHGVAGYPAAIDEVAALAAPTHRFLRGAWFAAGGDAGAVTLVGRRSDGQPFAAIPTLPVGPALAAARTVPGSYWPFRGVPLAADTSEAELVALLSDREARAALGRVWRLGPVYGSDPATRLLLTAARKAGWTVLTRGLGSTFVQEIVPAAAAGRWPNEAKLRRVRAAERKLAAEAGVGFRTISGVGWSDAVLDDLAAIEARSWVGQATDGRGAKFLSPEQRGLWRTALRDPALAEMLSAEILDIGGEPAAFSFDLTVGACQYAIASSYDSRWASFGPGKIVTWRQLAGVLDRGVTRIDWGAGDSGYKREFGAVPGAAIVDFLFVRGRSLATVLRARWKSPADVSVPVDGLGPAEQALIASLGMAAAAIVFLE